MKYPYTWKQTVAALAVFVAGSTVPGCIERIIPVRTTIGQVDRGFPERMTVATAPVHRSRYIAGENAFLEELDGNIEAGREIVGFIGGLSSVATSPEGLAALGLTPFTGGASMLSLLAGYAIKRRRDVTPEDHAQGKEDSFNKGVEVASVLIETSSGISSSEAHGDS